MKQHCTLVPIKGVLKSANLLYKKGFVDSKMVATVGFQKLPKFFPVPIHKGITPVPANCVLVSNLGHAHA